MKSLSTLLSGIPPSATMAVNDKAKRLKAEGKDIIALAGGDPNFDTPKHIQEAAFTAISNGDTHYPGPARGTNASVSAIVNKYKADTGLDVANTQVIVTPGGKWALNLALAAMLNPGDEVIYLEPVWVSYPPMITLAGGTPVAVSLPSETNFTITAELLEEKVTANTKAIMITSPSNPTGRVITRAEADAIVKVAVENDIYVIFDELYEKLIYDGKHIPLSAEPGMAERTVVVNGLSKAYAMTGWRLGWMIAPPAIAKLSATLHSQAITAASSFGMAAIEAALNGPQDDVETMRLAYKDRRDFMVDALNAIDGVHCESIEGAFYLFPRFDLGLTSMELAEQLMDAGVVGTPGSAFGAAGEGHLRFSIASSMEDLVEAAKRIKAFVESR